MALSRREILRAMDRLEGPIAAAFREAVSRITSRAQLNRLVEAIRRQDVEAAFRAAGLRESAWTPVTEQIRGAYIEGGVLAASDAPARLGFDFNVNNPRAQRWLAEESSRLVTRINDDQRDMIRSVLREGVEQGKNPRSTALEIVGRVDRRSGRRVGGLVGLTDQQAGYVQNARQQLLSGDPEQMREYLTRTRRDRRFDGVVRRAIDAGEPVSASDVDRMTGRYADRLLQTRGENVARTETLSAMNEGMDESLRQAVDEGLVDPQNVTRVWDATSDLRTREWHAAADGQRRGLNEPFAVGGALMLHPGDPAGGARNTIACRCTLRQEIDWAAEAQ
jgi:hypothetical protein